MRRLLLAAAALAALGACRKAPPPPAERLKKAAESVKSLPPCANAVPNEWLSSWPVPSGDPAGKRFKIFFFAADRVEPVGLRLREPRGEAEIELDKEAALSCAASTAPAAALPSGPRFASKADSLSLEEFEAKAALLLDRTEEAARAYGAGAPLSDAQRDALKEFLSAFETLSEPALLPWYYRANPAFWQWVRKEAGRSIPTPS